MLLRLFLSLANQLVIEALSILEMELRVFTVSHLAPLQHKPGII